MSGFQLDVKSEQEAVHIEQYGEKQVEVCVSTRRIQ
jgi:hypothetical protein